MVKSTNSQDHSTLVNDQDVTYEQVLNLGFASMANEWLKHGARDYKALGFDMVIELVERYPFGDVPFQQEKSAYILELHKQIINLLNIRKIAFSEDDVPGKFIHSAKAFLEGIMVATGTKDLLTNPKAPAEQYSIDICYDCLDALHEVLKTGDNVLQEVQNSSI